MTNARLANAKLVNAKPVDAKAVDEYAETQVLVDKPGKPGKRAPADDDATAQSAYSEYVQEMERMLKTGTAK